MTYQGHIHNGVVVLNEPVALPEGCRIECVLFDDEQRKKPAAKPLYEDLMEFAGKAAGLPEDASENIGHYLYGHAKRDT